MHFLLFTLYDMLSSGVSLAFLPSASITPVNPFRLFELVPFSLTISPFTVYVKLSLSRPVPDILSFNPSLSFLLPTLLPLFFLTHPLLLSSLLDRNCPVCLEFLHTTTLSLQVPQCGHILHRHCWNELLQST